MPNICISFNSITHHFKTGFADRAADFKLTFHLTVTVFVSLLLQLFDYSLGHVYYSGNYLIT